VFLSSLTEARYFITTGANVHLRSLQTVIDIAFAVSMHADAAVRVILFKLTAALYRGLPASHIVAYP
jgi:hypothetical protein